MSVFYKNWITLFNIECDNIMYRILYYPFILSITLFSLLPLKVHYFFSDILAFFLRKVIRYRVSTVYVNLSRAFPEINYKEIEKLVKEFYTYLADVIVETIWSFTRSQEKVSHIISYEGTLLAKELGAERGKVVVMMAHQGNWELCSNVYSLRENLGIDMDNKNIFLVFKRLEGKIANRVIKDIRYHKNNCTLLDSSMVLRHMLKNKEENGIYVFIADQNPIIGTEYAVNFLGQPTLMIKGPEFVARKMGLPVMFFYLDREKRGKYALKALRICDDASKVPEGYVTWKFAKILEERIMANKYNWLWSHKRWKRAVNKEDILNFDNYLQDEKCS